MTEVRYPEVEIDLSGEDGNAMFIIGRVRKALRRAGVSNETLDEFSSEATSGDYDHVLQTVMKWVTTN